MLISFLDRNLKLRVSSLLNFIIRVVDNWLLKLVLNLTLQSPDLLTDQRQMERCKRKLQIEKNIKRFQIQSMDLIGRHGLEKKY